MNTAILLIILIPVIEIYLFIKIGSEIGAFLTISLIFVTAILGILYARMEGFNTLRNGAKGVALIDGRKQNAVLMELLTKQGAGTLIKK